MTIGVFRSCLTCGVGFQYREAEDKSYFCSDSCLRQYGARTLMNYEAIEASSLAHPTRHGQGDLARMVFSTDPRVLAHARLRFECVGPSSGGDTLKLTSEEEVLRLREAVDKLWTLGEQGHEPEVLWYREAQALGERVGKPWHETPQPTLVEALARAQKSPLWPLGFQTLELSPHQHGFLVASPYIDFTGEYLTFSCGVGEQLLIHDVKIGNTSCMVSSSPMPGSLFASGAFPFRLQMEKARIGQQVRLYVENLSDVRLTVNAVLLGQVDLR
jgi:hypothetical protein